MSREPLETVERAGVPYVDLGLEAREIRDELLAAFEAVLDSGQYVLGPALARFEREFSDYCSTRYAVGVSSGTSALHLVLRGLGVGEGDEVITAPNTFIACGSAIALTGAKPVFVDIGGDMNVDPDAVAKAITSRTRGIMPVHFVGRPARMPEILRIAKEHDLFVLEDAAQAVGSRLEGRRVGSWGTAACFSLHPLKNLHAVGDGGMITTDDHAIFEKMVRSRNHGLKNRDECAFWSHNARLDDLKAALLSVELRHLDRKTEARRRLAFRYNELLKPYVEVPLEGEGEYHVYQTYMIQVDHRDGLVRHLRENGVGASVHYPIPTPLQPAAKGWGYSSSDFPVAMKVMSRIVSLPLFPVMTEVQQDQVVELIVAFYRGRKRKTSGNAGQI